MYCSIYTKDLSKYLKSRKITTVCFSHANHHIYLPNALIKKRLVSLKSLHKQQKLFSYGLNCRINFLHQKFSS